MNVLITGAAGFIGFSVARALLARGDTVFGIDILSDYYDPALKQSRLDVLNENENFTHFNVDITDYEALEEIAKNNKIDRILHLAAQAGVRYSIENPFSYQELNNKGTLNMLEIARHYNVEHFISASSSSVYGANEEKPFKETHDVSKPMSLYAATKRNGELMCYTYNSLYNIKCRCLRFFTVYGPWGRPDMALFLFAKKIIDGEEIPVFNEGKMRRDFTYIDDIVQGVLASIDCDFEYEIFNLAGGRVVELLDYIKALEKALGKEAKMNLMPMQPGDVPESNADISKAKEMLKYEPTMNVEEGVQRFVDWFKEYYKVE